MDSGNIAIARQAYQAYADSDRSAIEAVIGQDVRFTSPLDNGLDRETYFGRCWPNHETLSRFEFVRLLGHGDEVFVTYEAETTGGRAFRNTEVRTIRDGRIVGIEVYFGWTIPHEAKPGGFVGA
jgi:ketosteroid isomerase-like protein